MTKTETPTKLQLSCKDKMFDKIRNKHFATIFSVLGVTAKQLAAAQVPFGVFERKLVDLERGKLLDY